MVRSRLWVIPGATTVAMVAMDVPGAGAEIKIGALLRSSLASACDSAAPGLKRMATEIDENAAALHHRLISNGANIAGWTRSFLIRQLGIIEITRLAPGGTLANVQVDLQVSDGSRVLPIYSLLANGDCEVVEGRRLYYRQDGNVDRLELLDRNLVPTSAAIELNPTFPEPELSNSQSSGVRVAVVDSGVNYRLPHIASALARDSAHKPLGYDYWDVDNHPFDSDTRHSPFFPLRRGTRTASILTMESPGARLVPYRFPYPDVGRMVDLVADADRVGVRIVLISFEGRGRGDWRPFRRAAANHQGLLFVISAGIGGRDLDRNPLFPASLDLANAIIVTGVTRAGDLLAGVNWGQNTVDLAIVADEFPALGFDGSVRSVSGTSVAAARIAAMAVQLFEVNPSWTAQQVRTEIVGRARQPKTTDRRTRYGVIETAPHPQTTADPS